jgi:hypothetical protein
MPKIKYKNFAFRESTLDMIKTVNQIVAEYQAQGFDLTLRQLYYQLVSRDLLPNKVSEYKRLGSIVNDARLAGLIDWDVIVDRTRNLRSLSHWSNPAEIMDSAALSFRIDKWAVGGTRPEIWVEKDALVGVLEGVCNENDVPYFSCRGYTSQSEMWGAAMRLLGWIKGGQTPIIFHLGDHDPSGKDMTRDIADRLRMFTGRRIKVDRLALNYDQIEKYNPPPNPAKETDARYQAYIMEFGAESWELDALDPTVIAALIEKAIKSVRDETAWAQAVAQEQTGRDLLSNASAHWEEVVKFLSIDNE